MRSLLYEKKILFSGTSPFYTQLNCLLRNTQHVSRLQMWTIPFSREFKNRLQIFRYHSINYVSVFNSTIEFTSSVITCTYHFTTWLELHFACSFFVLCTKAIQNFKTDRLHQSCSLRTRLEFVCELAGDWH